MDRVFFLLMIMVMVMAYFGSIIWLACDAAKHRVSNVTWWVSCAFAMWIVVFPLYLALRPSMIRDAQKHPEIEPQKWMGWRPALYIIGACVVMLGFMVMGFMDYSPQKAESLENSSDVPSAVQESSIPTPDEDTAIVIDPKTGKPVWAGPQSTNGADEQR